MKLSRREKVLLALLAILSVIFVFYNFIYKPLIEEKELLLSDSAYLKTLIEKGEAGRKERLDLAREEAVIRKEYEGLLAAVPSSARVPETIAFLQQSSKDTNVSLLSTKYVPVKKSKNEGNAPNGQKNQPAAKIIDKAQEVSYSISARGSYNNLLSFMLKIENAPCLYIIRSCKIQSSPRKIDESLFSQVVQPIEGDQPAVPLVPAPVPSLTIPKGSALYDGGNLVLYLEFSAYYYKDNLNLDTAKTDNQVEPGQGSINPFQK
ncbi:MAG: hypothetical protein ABFD08_18475 [Syntrophomonas sp.]